MSYIDVAQDNFCSVAKEMGFLESSKEYNNETRLKMRAKTKSPTVNFSNYSAKVQKPIKVNFKTVILK